MSIAQPMMRRTATLYCGLLIFAAWLILAFGATFIAPYDPTAPNDTLVLQPPTALHWFGADNLGRDVLSRVMYAGRLDIAMAVLAVFPPFVIGCAVGLFAGFFGGVCGYLPMRLLEATESFPQFILILAIASIIGPGLPGFFIAVALVGWVNHARLIRAQVQLLKHRGFVTAVHRLGFSRPRILLLHILPNAVLPAAAFALSDIALILVLAVSLNYLGLGVQPPATEWGRMISEGQPFLAQAWWICFFPGLAIVVLALGFRLLADGLAEQLGVEA